MTVDPGGSDAVRFVRETLGCGCPDEVVARTVLDRSAAGEPGLDVGGRLLVRVLASDDRDRLVGTFAATVERLRAERDRRGFNRLRLVVVLPDRQAALARALETELGAIAVGDDRVHLHAVAPGVLPDVLAEPDRHGSS